MWQESRIMLHLVHSDALHFGTPVASYWEESASPLALKLAPLEKDEVCDVAIIGGGFTGLSAAIELSTYGLDVRLLEAGHIGWGASGRNGGFACIGSHKLSYPAMIKTYGLDAAKSFYNAMRDSVDLVADNLARQNIDAWAYGKGEITLAHAPNRVSEFRADQDFLKSVFGEETDLLNQTELREEGLHGPEFHGGLRGRSGFGIHPLNYVRGLARAAHKSGAKLHPHSRVVRWEQQDGFHVVRSAKGSVKARKVLVATNGYTPEDVSPLHAGRILPALSNIIVTRTLTESERVEQGWTSSTMAYDSRNLLHYFRLLPNGRFLFGGRGGTDSSTSAASHYKTSIIDTFNRLFPAWRDAEITHFWRGFVCLAYDLVPYVGPLDDQKTVWTALAYHGNGVAMGSWCGRAVARVMAGQAARDEVPAVITRRLARFPLPAFRPVYLKGAYLWYGWQDAR
jgi:glycine/D-amino acid oxidase-like deaminating enzyme